MTVKELLEKFRIKDTKISIRVCNCFCFICYPDTCPVAYLYRKVYDIIPFYKNSNSVENECFIINIEDMED